MPEDFQLARGFIEVRMEVGALRAQMDQLSREVKTRMSSAGAGAGAALAGQFAKFLSAAILLRELKSLVQETANFSKSMAFVGTLLDSETLPLLKGMREQVLGVSQEVGVSADITARALYQILSAAVPADKALGVLRASAIAAVGGFSDVATVADVVTTVLNAYKMSADDALKVTDILFKTVDRGKTTFDELAASLGNVVTIAAISGVSLEELGAAIATITRSGIKTPDAITAIQGALQSFLDPQDDAIVAARQFGIELNTETIRRIGLLGVMRKLQSASVEELNQIGGRIRGFKAFAVLVNDVSGFMKDFDLNTRAAGRTLDVFKTASDNLATSFDRVKVAWSHLKIAMGETVEVPLASVLESIKDAISGFSNAIKELRRIIDETMRGVPPEKEVTAFMEEAADAAARAGPVSLQPIEEVFESDKILAEQELMRQMARERTDARALGGTTRPTQVQAGLVPGQVPEWMKRLPLPRTDAEKAQDEALRVAQEQAAGRAKLMKEAFVVAGRVAGQVAEAGAKIVEGIVAGLPKLAEAALILDEAAVDRERQESELFQARLLSLDQVAEAEAEAVRQKYREERMELRGILAERLEGLTGIARKMLMEEHAASLEVVEKREDLELRAIARREERKEAAEVARAAEADEVLTAGLLDPMSGLRNFRVEGFTRAVGFRGALADQDNAGRQRERQIDILKKIEKNVREPVAAVGP